jgi:hypothetical protein
LEIAAQRGVIPTPPEWLSQYGQGGDGASFEPAPPKLDADPQQNSSTTPPPSS